MAVSNPTPTPPRPSYGAMEKAPGGARTAVPPYIMQCFRRARDTVGRSDSRDPLADDFRHGLFLEVRFDHLHPDALVLSSLNICIFVYP
jgi:hypothetical protein